MSGMAVVVLVSLNVRPTSEALVEETGAKPLVNATIMVLAVPLAVLIVLLITRGPARKLLGYRRMGRTFGLWLITVALPIVLLSEIDFESKGLPFENVSEQNVATWLADTLILALVVWWIVYMACGVFWAVRSYCFVGEFHPLLAPTLTGVTAIGLAVRDLVEGDTNGLAHDVWLTLILCGLATTLILATAEYWQLVRLGVGWRTGPQPVPRSEPWPSIALGERMPPNHVQWSEFDECLWHTCAIIADVVEGRLEHRPLIATMTALNPGERALVTCPCEVHMWRTLGDGSYMHGGVAAVGSPTFVIGALAASAFTNASRRRKARRDAEWRWVPEGTWELTITSYKASFRLAQKMFEVPWHTLNSIDLTAIDSVQIGYLGNSGKQETLILRTPWASLIFALGALVSFPAHPRLLGRTWLPPGFEQRCAAAGRPCRPAATLIAGP